MNSVTSSRLLCVSCAAKRAVSSSASSGRAVSLSAGDVVWPTLMHLLSYGVIMIPLGWWLAHRMPGDFPEIP